MNARQRNAFPRVAEAPSRRTGHSIPAQAESRPAQTLPGRAYPAIPRTPPNAMPSRASQKRLHHHVGHALPRQRSPAPHKSRPAELVLPNATPSRASQKRLHHHAGHALPHQRSPAQYKRRPAELIPPSRECPPAQCLPARRRSALSPCRSWRSRTSKARPAQTPPGRAYPAIPRTPAKRNASPRVAEAPLSPRRSCAPAPVKPAPHKRRSAELIPPSRERLPVYRRSALSPCRSCTPAPAKPRPAQTLPGRACPAKRNAFPYIAEAPTSPRRSWRSRTSKARPAQARPPDSAGCRRAHGRCSRVSPIVYANACARKYFLCACKHFVIFPQNTALRRRMMDWSAALPAARHGFAAESAAATDSACSAAHRCLGESGDYPAYSRDEAKSGRPRQIRRGASAMNMSLLPERESAQSPVCGAQSFFTGT